MSNFNIKTIVRQSIMARLPKAAEMDASMDLDAHIGSLFKEDLRVWAVAGKSQSLGLKALHQLEWIFRDVIQGAAAEVIYRKATGGKTGFVDGKFKAITALKAYFERLRLKYRSQLKNVNLNTELPWFSDFTKIGEDGEGQPLFQKTEFWKEEDFLRYVNTQQFKVKALRAKFDEQFAKLKLPKLGNIKDGMAGEATMRIFKAALVRKEKRWDEDGKVLDINEAMSWVFDGVNPKDLGLYVHTVGALIKSYNRAVNGIVGQLAGYQYNLKSSRTLPEVAGSTQLFSISGNEYEAPDLDTLIHNIGRESAWHTERQIQDWMDAIKRVLPENLMNAIDQPLHGGFEVVDADAGVFKKLPFDYMRFPVDGRDVVEAFDYKAAMEFQRARAESFVKMKTKQLDEAMEEFGAIQAPWM